MTVATLHRGGLRLAFHDAGGGGRPILLQHGLLGDAAQPLDYAGGRPGLRVLTLDCRGHGASEAPAPADMSIARFADDVAAALDGLDRRPAAIGGISMGAAIALRLAVVRPDLLDALVLVRPAWATAAAPATLSPNAEVGALLRRLPAAEARRAFLAGETGRRLADEAPDNLASLLSAFDRPDPAGTADLLQRIAADGPGVTEADVKALAVPTLVIANRRDHIHPLAIAERLAALIPGARLAVVTPKADDRARHMAEAGDAIAAFVSTLPGDRP